MDRVKEVIESADVDQANVKVLVTGKERCGRVCWCVQSLYVGSG